MAKRKEPAVDQLPKPVKSDSRICFGIDYFYTEAEANAYDAFIRERGDTYNGGVYHGMDCGRDSRFDHVDAASGKKLYAVTTR